MDAFLDQIDLKDKNGDSQVSNISNYLNVRRSDPLQLYPNFKHEDHALPCEHKPAVYREPMVVPIGEMWSKAEIPLEEFQF